MAKKLTFGLLSAAVLVVGTLSWSVPAGAEDEREHQIHKCIDDKRHEIDKMEERHEISRDEADRKRDHLHEECERMIEGH